MESGESKQGSHLLYLGEKNQKKYVFSPVFTASGKKLLAPWITFHVFERGGKQGRVTLGCCLLLLHSTRKDSGITWDGSARLSSHKSERHCLDLGKIQVCQICVFIAAKEKKKGNQACGDKFKKPSHFYLFLGISLTPQIKPAPRRYAAVCWFKSTKAINYLPNDQAEAVWECPRGHRGELPPAAIAIEEYCRQ